MCWLVRSCTDSLSIALVFPYLPIVNDNIQQDIVSLKMSRCYTSFDETEKSCYFECKSKESFFAWTHVVVVVVLLGVFCCFFVVFLSWFNFGIYFSYDSGAETIKEFFFHFVLTVAWGHFQCCVFWRHILCGRGTLLIPNNVKDWRQWFHETYSCEQEYTRSHLDSVMKPVFHQTLDENQVIFLNVERLQPTPWFKPVRFTIYAFCGSLLHAQATVIWNENTNCAIFRGTLLYVFVSICICIYLHIQHQSGSKKDIDSNFAPNFRFP